MEVRDDADFAAHESVPTAEVGVDAGTVEPVYERRSRTLEPTLEVHVGAIGRAARDRVLDRIAVDPPDLLADREFDTGIVEAEGAELDDGR